MVRGFDNTRPIWDFAPGRARIDVGTIKGADFSQAVAGMADNFAAGMDWTDKKVGNRNAANELRNAANSSASPAATILGLGAQGGPYGPPAGGSGTDQVYQPQPFNPRSVPTFAAQGSAPGGAKTMPSGTFWSPDNAKAIAEEASAAGYNPEDLATIMSYETGGTMNPWQKGPTTKWGQHRGLIQWGQPQAAQYGVTADMPFRDQVKASIKYLQDRGLKPGMGALEMYSAINAGGISENHFNRSDRAAGGAPGTVRDKVQQQMHGHRAKASAWLSSVNGQPDPQQVAAPAPSPQTVAPQTQAASTPVSATTPPTVQTQARQVLEQPDQYDPRTVEWARANAGNQQAAQPAAAPQLAPSPNDREVAGQVVQNQVETQAASQAARPAPTFMGLPTMAPGGNVNPGGPLAGGSGTDQIIGGGGRDQQAAPQAAPQVAQAPQVAPQAPQAPQAAPAGPRAPYRPPVQAAPQTGANPAVMRALAAAIQGGDPTAVSGVQSALSATTKAGGGRGNISMEQLPDGSVVLFNAETGEVSPYQQGGQVAQKAPTVQSINGVDHQWTGNGWQPLGTAQTKAPETKEVNGTLYQWDPAARQWAPAIQGAPPAAKAPEVREINGVSHQWDATTQRWQPLAGAAPQGAQFELINPNDTQKRAAANIDPNDKRTYQRDVRTGKLDPINEQRAVDDKTFQQETSLREKYEGITKDQRAGREAFSRIQASVADIETAGPTPASDMGLVFGLMKMYDPTSVVRETEYANAQNAGSAPERITNAYNKVLEGTILTPAQRADFVRQAYNLQKENVKLHNGQAKRFQELAKRYELRPEMVAEVWEEPGETPTRKDVRDRQGASGVPYNQAGEVEVVSERAAENLRLPPGTILRFTAGPNKGKRGIVE